MLTQTAFFSIPAWPTLFNHVLNTRISIIIPWAEPCCFTMNPFQGTDIFIQKLVPRCTCIFQLRSYLRCMCNFLYILWTIPKVVLYCTQPFVCFSCCHGNMGWPLELVTDGNPKVWEAINLFQLYTKEDNFSLGWIVVMWDGNNFTFGKIKLHLPMILPGS